MADIVPRPGLNLAFTEQNVRGGRHYPGVEHCRPPDVTKKNWACILAKAKILCDKGANISVLTVATGLVGT